MIALFQSMTVLGLSLYRIKYGFLCFIFLLPFMPRYLGLPIGTGSLSAKRIIMLLLCVVFFLWVQQNSKWSTIFNIIQKSRYIFTLLFLLFLIKLLATLLTSGLSNALYVIDDFLFSIPVVLMSMLFLQKDNEKTLFVILICSSFFISEILSIIEFIKQAPLLLGLIDFSVYNSDSASTGRLRNELYRASALFDNPLLLSEFLCITWPFIWLSFHKSFSKWLKLIALPSFILIPIAFYCIGARSAWLIWFLTILFMIFVFLWYRLGNLYKTLTFLICIVLSTLVISLIVDVFKNPESYLDYLSSSDTDSQDKSTLERISQFSVVLTALQEKPLLGYGAQQNFADDLEFLNNLDNYWLRVGLEGGISGVIAFFLILMFMLKKTANLRTNITDDYERKYLLAIIGSFFAFSCYKFFLSMPTNNIYFYILTGMIVGWVSNENNEGDGAEQ